MIRFVGVILIAWCGTLHGFAQAPTQRPLSQQLLAEQASTLARDARARGDSVRGAILFAQKSLNCTTCHAQGSNDLLGPDLTRVGAGKKDEYFVEAILRPSKEISKGFESTKLLTSEGRVIAGRLIRDAPDQIVIRDLSGTNRLIKVAKEDIERIEQDAASAMPEKLADHLTDRQQFLDLVKYVMEIADTGPSIAQSSPTNDVDRGKIGNRIHGRVLLDRFGCVNCHRDDTDWIPQKQGPSLTSATARIDPRYIRRFIADPLNVKPGTSMPNVMAHLPGELREEASAAITLYLLSIADEPFKRQSIDSTSAKRGRELFHTVGCVACHSPRSDEGIETLAATSVALGDLTLKYGVGGLATFLEDPHSSRPSGRMPNLALSHFEAIDIANYLLEKSTDGDGPHGSESLLQMDAEKALLGKQFFGELGCANCHQVDDVGPGNPATQATAKRPNSRRDVPSLATLDSDKGCLSSEDGTWPHYELDPTQRDAIRVALGQSDEPFSDQQKIVLTMETFRCLNCHRRDDLGGVSDERDIFFHTTNENLGPQGRIPPTLTGVGGKLKPKWLREVLVSGRAIRPYMKTRMPQYGAKNVAHAVDLLARVDQMPLEVPSTEIAEPIDRKEIRKVGTDLVGKGGLNCIACHTFQHKPAQTMPAVDLTEMAERLHKQWFYRYMLSPQSLSRNTVMPSFWPGGKAIRKEILDGDSTRQIGAIWEYLLDGRQARTPRGMQTEPIELVASDGHAVMLRRSYRDVGKRGIGVGYPGGVNLVFDAEQMRLAMIWKGKFADPAGVWRSQGHGTVRPLGGEMIRFEPGPDFDDAEKPWTIDTGRPPDHQFAGYRLDDQDRPTFTYRFGDVEVDDYATDLKDGDAAPARLKRTLTFTSKNARQNSVFRVANGKKISAAEDHTFLVDDSLRILVDQRYDAEVVETETGMRLIVPLDIPAGKSELVLHYTW